MELLTVDIDEIVVVAEEQLYVIERKRPRDVDPARWLSAVVAAARELRDDPGRHPGVRIEEALGWTRRHELARPVAVANKAGLELIRRCCGDVDA